MAHFAELDKQNIVLQVIVISNSDCHEPPLSFPETEPFGQAFIRDVLGYGNTWLQCSYNGSFRGNYPGPGWIYNSTTDTFDPPYTPDEELPAGE